MTGATYDALNRLTQRSCADGSTTTYTWDAGNRLTQVVDSLSGMITRTYDGLDRLTQEVTPQGTVSATYDTADRLTQISQGTSVVTLGYDAAGRRTSLSLPNGVITEYAYDTASRLTGLTYRKDANTLGTLTYAYDAAGNRIQTGGSWARTGLPQAVPSATYNAANHQLTFGGQSLSYDLNGNLVSDGTTTYTWDARNRLVSLTAPGVTGSFQYDPLGRRTRKTINGATTDFLHDGLNPVREIGGTTTELLTGLGIDEYLTRTDAGGTRGFLGDALGSTLALTDSTGAVQTEYTYEPFGAATGAGGGGNAFQFTGRENDQTGLYYYRARYYHPTFQRLISEDPAEFVFGELNLYGYVMNNPLLYRDPHGLALDDWTGFPSPEEHFGRNQHNRCPPTPPPLGSKSSGPKWSQDPWGDGKYRSTDGSECIYDTRGNPLLGGTYNYGPWRPVPPYWPFLWRHIWKDVIPHFWYGGDNYPVGGPP